MPLPWNKKWGFYYIYQPYFIPLLGVFGKADTRYFLKEFLEAIPKRFRFWEIDLQEKNYSLDLNLNPKLLFRERKNHWLALNANHDELKKNYSRLARRMLKKATDNELQIYRNEDPGLVIHSYQNEYGKRHPKIRMIHYKRLKKAAEMLAQSGKAVTYIARNPENKILAFYLVLLDSKFVYSLIGGSVAEGLKDGAFYALTDAAIKDHAGTQRMFRFEGSDIPGIALFDSQFGSVPTKYFHLKMNNLPFPINLLK
jgi:hypothetical protein